MSFSFSKPIKSKKNDHKKLTDYGGTTATISTPPVFDKYDNPHCSLGKALQNREFVVGELEQIFATDNPEKLKKLCAAGLSLNFCLDTQAQHTLVIEAIKQKAKNCLTYLVSIGGLEHTFMPEALYLPNALFYLFVGENRQNWHNHSAADMKIMLQTLLGAGVDPNLTNQFGQNSLFYATQCGSTLAFDTIVHSGYFNKEHMFSIETQKDKNLFILAQFFMSTSIVEQFMDRILPHIQTLEDYALCVEAGKRYIAKKDILAPDFPDMKIMLQNTLDNSPYWAKICQEFKVLSEQQSIAQHIAPQDLDKTGTLLSTLRRPSSLRKI